MRDDPVYRRIIQEIAEEKSLPVIQINEIVEAQFRAIKNTMSAGLFHTVRLPWLGKFVVKNGRLRAINQRFKRNPFSR